MIGTGALLWLGALVAVLRDRRASRARRAATAAILVITVPVAFFYWRSTR